MAQILFTATDAEGREARGMVEADGVAQAREQLLARGLRDVQMQLEASFSPDLKHFAASTHLDPQEVAAMALRFIDKPGLVTLLREVARTWKWPVACVCAVAALALWLGHPVWAAALLVLATVPFGVATWQFRRVRDHDRLLRAQAVGHWTAVVSLAESLGSTADGNETLAFDLAVRGAYARIRQGQPLAVAVAALESAHWPARVAANGGAYEAQIALLHAAADEPQGCIDAMRRSAAASNNEPARLLDLALAEARLGDADEAERVLAGIDTSLLPPHATGFLAWTRGLIAMRRESPEAGPLLDDAVRAFLTLSAKHPAVWTSLAFSVSDQVLLLRAGGQIAKARAALAPVWPILRAHARAQLLSDLADLRPADAATSASQA